MKLGTRNIFALIWRGIVWVFHGPARGKKRTRWGYIWILPAIAGVLSLVPVVYVSLGTREAKSCFAKIEAPRGPELPDCGGAMRWFLFPSRFPWTLTPATYRAEELRVRMLLVDYENAIVAAPDKETRARAAGSIREAEEIVRSGSQRLAFEELGPAVGAPNPAQDALLHGDRATLLDHGEAWIEWHARLHTLEAALLEARFDRALEIARHYATYDPRDEDLRAMVGALMCLDGDAQKGLDLLTFLQSDRAGRRYAAMSRNWGDVRTAILACASRGGLLPPLRPNGDAGQDDQRDVRAPLRLRVAANDPEALADARQSAVTILGGPLAPGVRVAVVAALLRSGADFVPEQWVDFASSRTEEGEGPLVVLGPPHVSSWQSSTAARPALTADVYAYAADRLRLIAQRAPEMLAPQVATAEGAMWIEAARAASEAADGATSDAALERAAGLVITNEPTLGLARSFAWYASADVDTALAVLPDPSQIADEEIDLRAAILTQRAELLGVIGDPDRRAAAAMALAVAEESRSSLVRAWSRWVYAWLAPPSPGASFPGSASGPADPQVLDVRSYNAVEGRFSLWPSTGVANSLLTWTPQDQERIARVDAQLATWDAARIQAPDDRRALRYAFLRQRGDAPPWLVPWLGVASGLLQNDGDHEVWLDAVLASDAPRFSLRTIAWARALAARSRGDSASHALWLNRFRALAARARDEAQLDLVRYLKI